MTETQGKKPRPRDIVVLTEVPPGLLDNLPIEDQQAIFKIVGKPILLSDYDDYGRTELEFKGSSGVVHFIYVSPSFIRTAN